MFLPPLSSLKCCKRNFEHPVYSSDKPFKSNTALAIYADETAIFYKNLNYNYCDAETSQ